MKIVANLIGFALLALGALWALQGVGVVGGSFMTGAGEWLYIGAATAAAGLGLLFWFNWGQPRGLRTKHKR